MDENGQRMMRSAVLLSAVFVAATMAANIMSLRMIAPLSIVMDAGALLYPVTFVVRDLLHRRCGLSAANHAVTISVFCNVCMFALFWLASALPADLTTGTQEAFGQVLLPGALIVLGSVVAQFISERLDGRIFQRIWRDGEGSHIKAALVSNVISIPVDSAIMCGIAFGFTVPLGSVVAATLANIAIKYVVMAISLVVYAAAESTHATE